MGDWTKFLEAQRLAPPKMPSLPIGGSEALTNPMAWRRRCHQLSPRGSGDRPFPRIIVSVKGFLTHARNMVNKR
jgi:hypothetical protein